MNDNLLNELREIGRLFYIANKRLNSIINKNAYQIYLEYENLSRIENILSNNEDIKDIKDIVKITYGKIKEYLSQSVLPNDYYTLSDIYIEYYYLLSEGRKVVDINKTFYTNIIVRYKSNIIIESYKKRLYNNE